MRRAASLDGRIFTKFFPGLVLIDDYLYNLEKNILPRLILINKDYLWYFYKEKQLNLEKKKILPRLSTDR